jgi:hypothetical protein
VLIKTKRSFEHDLSTLGFRVSGENTNSRVWIRAAGGEPKRGQRHLLDLHAGEAVGDGGVLLHLGLLGAERVVGERVHVHHRRRRDHHLLLLLLSSLRELPHELRRSPEAAETRLRGRWVGPGWGEALRRVSGRSQMDRMARVRVRSLLPAFIGDGQDGAGRRRAVNASRPIHPEPVSMFD